MSLSFNVAGAASQQIDTVGKVAWQAAYVITSTLAQTEISESLINV